MSRISNKNRKKHYDNYKMGGHYDTNKRLKQARHEKRMARFAKRKEEGKTYVYSKERAEAKREEALRHVGNVTLGTNVGGNRGRDTEVAKTTSIFRKLRNQLEAEAAKEKEKLLKSKEKVNVA